MSSETLLNNRYRLVSQLASGGMAVIYKAIDQSLGRTVAIKILRPSLTVDPIFVARFQNEARSIANLAHPNIVTVHDVGSQGPTHYIVMELVDGADLKNMIRARGALPLDRVLKFGIEICAGLGFAHRAGIVHADVKPQNVLMTKNEVVKITDFGIAQALSDTQPQQRESVVWGSPHYFAPEQAQGEKPTAASDVYSIGIVLFEMLTGRLPYTGTNQQELALAHIRNPVPLASDINPNVPKDLAEIVRKVMDKEPRDRYRTADQLGQILIAYKERMDAGGGVASKKINQSSGNFSPDVTSPSQKLTQPPPQSTMPSGSIPPQSGGQPPAPNYSQQPSPLSGIPTQRMNMAPEAPRPPANMASNKGVPIDPRAGNVYAGNSQWNAQMQSPSQSIPAPRPNVDSGVRPPAPRSTTYRREIEEDIPKVWDTVTVILAFLAFSAVGCLVPLYLVVIGARF
ncbi:MAG: protein kinase [Phototrophicales bacterium]|nr:protein kinase [Phototrophicales bacterium]